MKPAVMLKAAHFSMGSSLALSLIILYVIYGTSWNPGIPLLILLHILLVVFAAIFKISYVVRLTALKQLGRPVH